MRKIILSLILFYNPYFCLASSGIVLSNDYTTSVDASEKYDAIIKDAVKSLLERWQSFTKYSALPVKRNKMKIAMIACDSNHCDIYESRFIYISGVVKEKGRRDPPNIADMVWTGDMYTDSDKNEMDVKNFYNDLQQQDDLSEVSLDTEGEVTAENLLNNHAHSEQAFLSHLKHYKEQSVNKINKTQYKFFLFVINSTRHACPICFQKMVGFNYNLFSPNYPWILKTRYNVSDQTETEMDDDVFNFKNNYKPNINIVYYNTYNQTELNIKSQTSQFSNTEEPKFYHFHNPTE
jgi:hypothetical protein